MVRCVPRLQSATDSPDKPNYHLSSKDCPTPDSKNWTYMQSIPYRSTIGVLLFLTCMTRPDFQFETVQACRFGQNPGKPHWIWVRQIVRYLHQTADYALTIDGNKWTEVVAYCDADWGGNVDDRRSVSGFVFMLCGCAIAWGSSLQKLVARSSFESELIALFVTTSHLLWIRRLLIAFGADIIQPIPIFVDNETVIYRTKEFMLTKRTKHIDLRYFAVSDLFQAGLSTPVKIDSADNLADSLTKAVAGARGVSHRSRLLNLAAAPAPPQKRAPLSTASLAPAKRTKTS